MLSLSAGMCHLSLSCAFVRPLTTPRFGTRCRLSPLNLPRTRGASISYANKYEPGAATSSFRPGVQMSQPHYGKASYWDDRYTKDPEIFDWYQRYSGLKDWISQYVRKDDNILMVGCGNSRLSEDMFDDGFTTLTNIDVSKVVVDQMAARYRDKPALSWVQMNVCALDFPDESFNTVIDKGTLDSVLCGEGSTANVAKMCMEISRVLKPNGVYFICSYGVPDNRLQYLENDDYSWTVTVHTIPKPTISAAAVPDTRDAESVHYLYVCKKGGTAEEGA